MIKLNILNMNGFLQIVNQCSGAVNAIFPDGKRRDLNKSYAAQKVMGPIQGESGEPGPETGFPEAGGLYKHCVLLYQRDLVR